MRGTVVKHLDRSEQWFEKSDRKGDDGCGEAKGWQRTAQIEVSKYNRLLLMWFEWCSK